MRKICIILLSCILSACATNKIHFAPYTSETDIEALRSYNQGIHIENIRGIEVCSSCTEMSKIVWHAANMPYEGFFPIPVKDWSEFIHQTLEKNEKSHSTKPIDIEINRIFLKTWQSPAYYACQVELTVRFNGLAYSGKGLVKLHGSGQNLVAYDRVKLDPVSIDAIKLALLGAYKSAMQQIPLE